MRYEIKPSLEKILKKLKKKDPVSFKAITNKIGEVVNSNPDHYKPLKHGMKNWKRVHVMKSFVLIFTYNKAEDLLSFLDYDHHDVVYRKH